MMKRNLLVIGLATLLGACGFQLRGTGDTQFALKEINLTARNSYGETYKQLRDLLQSSQVKVSTAAPYTLDLANEQESQRTASYTTNTRSAETQLTSTLDYQIKSRDGLLLLQDQVEVQKVYVQDGNNLIGSDEEAAQLRGEIRRDLVQQMAMRLQLINPERLAELEATARAKAKAEADARSAAAKARAEQPQQSPIQLPIGQ